ncbi:MAG: hypothetical protein KJ060_16045 [Candidatus Hydrogenedentes bacterium]|nr:hypothetical protein [Candidatus Hydrogenedentota bacterium]
MSTRLRQAFVMLRRTTPVIRDGARGAIVILLLACWYALLALEEDGKTVDDRFERTASETMGEVSRDSPAFALASELEDPLWELKQCSEAPDMNVAGRPGYYVVLGHEWWDTDPERSGRTRGLRQTFAQLFLVAEDQFASVPSPDDVPWSELPEAAPEWMSLDGPTENVYMGTAGGFHVFGHMTIPMQEDLRHRLGTSGGDDRTKLLERQLKRCTSDLAYQKTIRLLVHQGEAAIPILRREIGRLPVPQRRSVIYSLMQIPGPESAGILRDLYRQDATHEEMAYLMRIGPYRPDLEDIYAEIRADAQN